MGYKLILDNVGYQYFSKPDIRHNPYFTERFQRGIKVLKSELRKKVDGGYWSLNSKLDEITRLDGELKKSNLNQDESNAWKGLVDSLYDNKYLIKKATKDSNLGEKLKKISLSIDDYVNNYYSQKELIIEEPKSGFFNSLYKSKFFKPFVGGCIALTISLGLIMGCTNHSLEEKVNKKKSGYGEVLPRKNKAFYAAFDEKGYDKKADDLLALTERNIGKMSDEELFDDQIDINSLLSEVNISELTRLAKRSQTDIDDNKVEHFEKKLDKLRNYIAEIKREMEARNVSSVVLKKARVEFELEKANSTSDIASLKDYLSNFNNEYKDLENKVNFTKTNNDNDVLSQLVLDVNNLRKEKYAPVLSDLYSLGVFNSLVNRNTNEAARSLEYLVGVDDTSNVVIPTGLKKDWKIFNRKIIAHCNEQDPYWDWDNLNEITKFLKKAKEVSPDDYRNIRALALKHAVDELQNYKPKPFWKKVVHELMLWQNLWEGPEGIRHMFIPAKYKDNSNDIIVGNGKLTSGDLSNWLQDGLFATKEFAELYAVYCGIASLTSSGGGNGGSVVSPPTGGGGEGPGGPGGS